MACLSQIQQMHGIRISLQRKNILRTKEVKMWWMDEFLWYTRTVRMR